MNIVRTMYAYMYQKFVNPYFRRPMHLLYRTLPLRRCAMIIIAENFVVVVCLRLLLLLSLSRSGSGGAFAH